MLLGMLIALVVAIFVGQDSEKRGMNAWGWGAFVFLFMIIGLPCYFIFRKPKLEDQVQPEPEVLTPTETTEEEKISQ